MIQQLYGLTLFVCLCVFSGLPAAAASQISLLRGELQQERAVSYDQYVVEVSGQSGMMRRETANVSFGGEFEFRELPTGLYLVRVMSQRGAVVKEEFCELTSASSRISIRLPAVAAAQGAGEIVSVKRLQHKIPKKARHEFAIAQGLASPADHPNAIAHLRKAVEIDPEYVEALNNLGVRFIKLSQPETARSYLERAAQLDNSAAMVFVNLAAVYLMTDQPQASEQAARQALAVDPGQLRARYALGLALFRQRKWTQETEECLARSAAQFQQAHLPLAELLAQWGRLQDARQHANAYLASGEMELQPAAKALLGRLPE